ncbi:hypothetical protein B566_EDAN013076 [Ephemera danica]|nr:hypothetical protein B566_EDAN013076 [Ephemera danica]
MLVDSTQKFFLSSDASKVLTDLSALQGYVKEKAFIATQGPREETIGDFWRLVWQKNISCIIMLCNLTEAQTMKCAQYWPAVNTSAHHKDELLVRTDNEEAFLDYAVRNFTVTRGNASRTVTQLHYTAWPDHGVPRYAHSLASVLRQVPLDGSAPILVHCSAGVGRTGTVILALAGFAMGQAEGVVDMLALLANMRSQRPNMVDNATQYETAHRVLLELNTLPGCEQPIKNFHATFRSLQGLGILQTQFWDLSDACRRDILKSNDQYWPKDKNRFPDIVPGTEGRVLLERAGCSYINAVYVDGLRSRDRFVVTQLPLTNTLGDFWLMVWQREAKMVVVLNVPEPTFYLKRSKESREVSVLSVNHWRAGELTPHHPDSLVKLWSEMEGAPGTIVLACHDGATASGLMVSAALMLEHLHAAGIVDVASAVRRARRTRPQFITSLTQYEFLHTVALAEIENMDVYVNV